MKKTINLFLLSFIVSVAYGQNKKSVLLESNKVHTIEYLRSLNSRNNLFDKEGFQSNFGKIPTEFPQVNNDFHSRAKENGLRLDSIVSVPVDFIDRTEEAFDANGNVTLYLYYYWDTDSESFVKYVKAELTYDANNNMTMYRGYYWDTDSESFVPRDKTVQTYDAKGNMIHFITYTWDTDSESFVELEKAELTYDANGITTLYIYYTWDTDSESFVPSFKREEAFDAKGNVTLYMTYTWDTDSESLVGDVKREYTYDESKIIPLTTEVMYDWQISLGVFKRSYKKEDTIIQDNETSIVVMGTISKYDTNLNQWAEESEEFKSYKYYTKMTTLTREEFNETLFSIYPNPTSDYISIKTTKQLLKPQFQLFDVLGKKVLSQPIKATEAIDVQHLKPSLYFYRIKEGKEIRKSGTLIKQNK